MLALSDKEICSPLNVTRCILGALEQSCPDMSAKPICDKLSSECGGALPRCSPIISGLTGAGREELLSCVLPQFCDFDDCMQGLGLL
jgi:hypothetical protein